MVHNDQLRNVCCLEWSTLLLPWIGSLSRELEIFKKTVMVPPYDFFKIALSSKYRPKIKENKKAMVHNEQICNVCCWEQSAHNLRWNGLLGRDLMIFKRTVMVPPYDFFKIALSSKYRPEIMENKEAMVHNDQISNVCCWKQ